MACPAHPAGEFAQNWSWSVCRSCRLPPRVRGLLGAHQGAALTPANIALLKPPVREQNIAPIAQRDPDPSQGELDVEAEDPGVRMSRCSTGADVVLDARAKKQ